MIDRLKSTDRLTRVATPYTLHLTHDTPKRRQLAALQERLAQMENRDRLQRSVNVRRNST